MKSPVSKVINDLLKVTENDLSFLGYRQVLTTMSEANNKTFYEAPNQFVFDGIHFPGNNISNETLVKIKDEFAFRNDDILLATYAKSGKPSIIFSWILHNAYHISPILHKLLVQTATFEKVDICFNFKFT